MNSSYSYNVFASFLIGGLCCAAPLQGQKTAASVENETIFTQLFDAVKQVKTLRYNLRATERTDNKLSRANSIVKLNVSPMKIYYKSLSSGIEILWQEGVNDNDATVNPNGFPFFNLHLNPFGKLMRKNHHETINRLGYGHLTTILHHFMSQYPDTFQKYVSNNGDTVWDGTPCYKMTVAFPYTCTNYTVTQRGETVSTIAAKYYLCDYELLTINHLSWYEDELDIGQVLLLPNVYAKATTLFIRKDIFLPVVIRIYDATGLLEEYAFSKLQVNSTIPDIEFSEDYSNYHF